MDDLPSATPSSPQPDTLNADRRSRFIRATVFPMLIVAILEVGAIASVTDTNAMFAVANLGLFLYLGWIWNARQFGDRTTGISYAIAVGFILGFVIGGFKFLFWHKFYFLFYIITDPILNAIYGGVIIGFTLALLRSSRLRPYFQRFQQHK